LLPTLRRERWALVLDGTEVAQHESGAWFGRFLHPELGRLLEEIASEPMPGVAVFTSRVSLPTLGRGKNAKLVWPAGGGAGRARRSVGVGGSQAEWDARARAWGFHAKAVELLGTSLHRFEHGKASRFHALPEVAPAEGISDEELRVTRVLSAFGAALGPE